MNAIIKISILSILSIIICHTEVLCQQFNWEWAKKASETKNTPYLQITTTDTQNNSLFLSYYSDTIVFPDTTFSHPGHSYSENCAISRYNTNGRFLDAADIFTWPGNDLVIKDIFTDKSNNIIVAGEFMERVFFQDTFLVHTGGPYTFNNEVFILKYSPDYEIMWSGVIGSDYHDHLDDYTFHNGITCLALNILSSNQNNYYLYIFEDDSILIERECTSIISFDSNRNLVWVNEVVGAGTLDLFYGDDNVLYYCGYTEGNLLINNDTIIRFDPQNPSIEFIISFRENGEIDEVVTFDYNLRYFKIETSNTSEHYISGMIRDSLFINNETIVVPEDHKYQILIKHNSEMIPDWYTIIDQENNLYGINMDIGLTDNSIIFKTIGKGLVIIDDTTFNFSTKIETVFGELSLDGNLENVLTTSSFSQTYFGDFVLDNCQNIISGGRFWKYCIFNSDTLFENQTYDFTSCYAKINRNPNALLDLGNDTIVCESYTLDAPDGFTWYIWNDSLTTSNILFVDSSCTVRLECGNDDGCWLKDEIFIDVHSSSTVIPTSDTTLPVVDSLFIDIGDDFEYINWFNGTQMETITLHGSDYGEGTYLFWVETFDGICNLYDTIAVNFVNTDFINEYEPVKITLYPLPVSNNCYIKSNSIIEKIELYNQYGGKLQLIDQTQISLTNTEIIMNELNPGVYYAIITINSKNFLRKIIKV